jgi:hypothetical protein
MAAGYRDAKRALAVRRRVEASARTTRRRTSERPKDEGPVAAVDVPEAAGKVVSLRKGEPRDGS